MAPPRRPLKRPSGPPIPGGPPGRFRGSSQGGSTSSPIPSAPATGCRPCCGRCEIATDRFTRANETPIASPWTKWEGTDANLSANVLDFPASATYRHNTIYPGTASESRHASVRAKVSSGTVQVFVGGSDKDNYFAATLYIPIGSCPVLLACANVAATGCSCTPAAGVTSCINCPLATVDTWVTLEVCLIANNGGYGYPLYDEVRAKVTLPDGTVYACKASVDGPAVGLYAGVRAYQAAQFDDFEYTYFRGSPTGQHSTCPNCNTPCLIGSDNFTTNELCNWFVVSGSYAVAAGVNVVAANSKIQFALPHPLLKTSKIVTVDIKWETGIKARVDMGNGYAIFDAAATSIKLYDSTNTLLSTTTGLPAFDNAMHSVSVCYKSGLLTATFGTVCANAASTDVANSFVYLGTDNATAVTFDNFVFSKTYSTTEPKDEGCDRCATCHSPCSYCSDGLGPDFFQLDLPTSPAPCFFCKDPFSGGSLIINRLDPCRWQVGYSNLACQPCLGGYYDLIQVIARGAPPWYNPVFGPPVDTYRIRIIHNENDDIPVCGGSGAHPFNVITWEKDYGITKPDCLNLVNEEIPWVGSDINELARHSGAGGGCNGTNFGPAFLTSL